MKATAPASQHAALPRVPAAVMKVFAAYSRRYVGKHFTALRVLRDALPPQDCARPIVVFLNHAAWWDPLVCLLLSREYFAARTSFAPIDAAMLQRYAFFKHLGFFGIEQHTAGGALKFLRTAHAILGSSAHALWLTPQGRFMDVRERPLRLQAGLGALAAREPDAVFIPLAIEYAFWTEPRPEILAAFGEPIVPADHSSRTAEEWTRTFTEALESTQDELAARSCRREQADWQTLNRGHAGVNGFYDFWRRLRAGFRGEKFTPEHHPDSAP